jgi:Tol biopolymer transport system component
VIVFSSSAEDLVPGDVNGIRDVFVRDLGARTTERVSVGLGGAPADGPSDLPRLSADGRVVVFASDATNLVAGDTNAARDVFVFDRRERVVRRVSEHRGRQADGASDYPDVSDDGRCVAFTSFATNLGAERPPALLVAVLPE